MARVLWMVLAFSLAMTTPAVADGFTVEAHGIELTVPAGWVKQTKPRSTLLAPKKYKGRAIGIVGLPAMPEATAEALTKLIGVEGATITQAKLANRHGSKVVLASGTARGNTDATIDLIVLEAGKGATLVFSYTSADQDPLLRKQSAEVLLSARAIGPRLTVAFTPSKGKSELPRKYAQAIAKVAKTLDGMVRMPRPLPIRFEDCGYANATYNKDKQAITMCHELFADTLERFKASGLTGEPAVKASLEAITWVFFHELGHAFVGELDLPITGRGEDAADEIATLIMMKAGAFGHRASLAAAQWFQAGAARAAGKPPVYWGTHSLGQQRVVTIACLGYGALPGLYGPIMKQLGADNVRLAKCKRDYPLRMKAWNGMLARHTRRPPLR